MAHDLAGLVMHRDGARRMTDFNPVRDQRMPGQQRTKDALVAMKDEVERRIGLGRINKTGNNRCRSSIPAHCIQRDDGARCALLRKFRSVRHRSASGRGSGLRRVLVHVDFFGQRHDFTRVVVAAGAANVVRAL